MGKCDRYECMESTPSGAQRRDRYDRYEFVPGAQRRDRYDRYGTRRGAPRQVYTYNVYTYIIAEKKRVWFVPSDKEKI